MRCEAPRRNRTTGRRRQRGTAMVIALLIMSLLAIFTAATLSRVTNEAIVMSNDYGQSQAFYAAQASLEKMSRNFGRLFQASSRWSTALSTSAGPATAWIFVRSDGSSRFAIRP